MIKLNMTKEEQMAYVRQDPHNICRILNPSEEVQQYAVDRRTEMLRWIKSEKVILKTVSMNGLCLEYVKNPSDAVKLAAVKENYISLRCIKNPSEELQLLAVNIDGYAIQYIVNPTEKVQLAAVTKSPYAIKLIKNPTEAAMITAIKSCSGCLKYITDYNVIMQTKEYWDKDLNLSDLTEEQFNEVAEMYNTLDLFK
jgi:hypothetical protein